MISPEYKRAVDIIFTDYWPLEHLQDFVDSVHIFKILVKHDCFAGNDDIYQYIKKKEMENGEIEENALNKASKIQLIYDVVRATIKPFPDYQYAENPLKKKLF